MKTVDDTYQIWLSRVQAALQSINMLFDDWQNVWRFDFENEFNAGAKADDAAMKANRFWWHEQNKTLKQDCRKTQNCWLPRGHQGDCQSVSSGAAKPTYGGPVTVRSVILNECTLFYFIAAEHCSIFPSCGRILVWTLPRTSKGRLAQRLTHGSTDT